MCSTLSNINFECQTLNSNKNGENCYGSASYLVFVANLKNCQNLLSFRDLTRFFYTFLEKIQAKNSLLLPVASQHARPLKQPNLKRQHNTLWLRVNYYTQKIGRHRQQWISHKMNIRHPGQLKKKWLGPFWSYQINSSANLAHFFR